MGKTQSKRSVDITTEPKKGTEEEVTEKLEKIDDLDQKQLNGDATPQESNDVTEKKDNDETENDKDLTTEKGAEVTAAIAENGDHNNTSLVSTEETPKEDTTAPKEGAVAEEITPLADESIKKTKKEKVKKKWSFRSISFGRKDKQKQTKNDETVETAATNGDADKTEEAPESPKTDDGIGDGDTKLTDKHENGNASEKELNGEKTPTPTEEEPTKPIDNENKTTTAPTPTVPATKNETAIENQTENKAALSSETIEEAATILNAALASNNHLEKETNGIEASVIDVNVVKETEPSTAAIADVSVGIENNKTIPSVLNDDKPHQNGTTEDDEEPEAVAAKLTKLQIEVNINIDNDNATATTLDSSPIPTEVFELNDNKSCNAVEAEIIQVSAGASGDKILEESKTGETAVPPPLPISSPPSQVSVFVLNTNVCNEELPPNETVEVVKAVLESIPLEQGTGILPSENPLGSHIPTTVDDIKKDINVDIDPEQEQITVATGFPVSESCQEMKGGANDVSEPTASGCDPAQVDHENSGDNPAVHFTSAAKIQLQPLAVQSSEETPSKIEDSETMLCAVLTESENTSRSANEDLVAVSEVVDDVTKKAIEIIEAQFDMPVEHSDKHANGITEDIDDCITEQTDSESQEQKPKQEEEIEAKNVNDSQDIGTTPSEKQKVPEDFLNEQEVQSKTLNNDGDNELSLSQDNAIAKEVTAAEITTQDLAVTCE